MGRHGDEYWQGAEARAQVRALRPCLHEAASLAGGGGVSLSVLAGMLSGPDVGDEVAQDAEAGPTGESRDAYNNRCVTVQGHRRPHLPILLDSKLFAEPVSVPGWGGAKLKLATYAGPATC